MDEQMYKEFSPNILQNDWHGPHNPGPNYDVESMKCPACGSNMVRRYALGIYLSDPPMKKLEWWCKCGKTLQICYEVIPGSHSEKPPWEREWEEANLTELTKENDYV